MNFIEVTNVGTFRDTSTRILIDPTKIVWLGDIADEGSGSRSLIGLHDSNNLYVTQTVEEVIELVRAGEESRYYSGFNSPREAITLPAMLPEVESVL